MMRPNKHSLTSTIKLMEMMEFDLTATGEKVPPLSVEL